MDSKSFDKADESRTPAKTRVDVVHLGNVHAARLTLEPGWRWSECIKPVAGTDSCQTPHVGVIAAGTIHVVLDDGTERDIQTGEAYVIEPGHDAWVVGDDAVVGYEFESKTAQTYATPSGS
jgi:hypothetical protein